VREEDDTRLKLKIVQDLQFLLKREPVNTYNTSHCPNDSTVHAGTFCTLKKCLGLIVVFWIVTPCSDMVGYQQFGGPCCFHFHFTL